MKKFLKSIGKAVLYLLFYFGIQVVISSIVGIVVATKMMLAGDMEMATFESDLLSYSAIITLISNVLSLGIIWLFFKIRKKRLVAEIELHKCSFRQVIAFFLFGIGFGYVAGWIIETIPFPESLMESFTTSHDALSIGNPVINFISVAILAPIVEEVFFRGIIYTRLKAGMPTLVAAILSAIMFGVMHGEIIWMIFAFGVGLMLVWVFEKTKSLLACIVVHVANNTLSQLTVNLPELSALGEWIVLLVSWILMIVSIAYIVRSCETKRIEVVETEVTEIDL